MDIFTSNTREILESLKEPTWPGISDEGLDSLIEAVVQVMVEQGWVKWDSEKVADFLIGEALVRGVLKGFVTASELKTAWPRVYNDYLNKAAALLAALKEGNNG